MAFGVATPNHPLTVDEYLGLEEASSVKHDYVGGEIYAHAGASRRHNSVAGNLFARLWAAARGGPCRVFGSDMRLRVADDVFYYPDIQVVCEPDDDDERFTSRPCLVVEVFSPTTEAVDRREKPLNYRRLASLKAYLMVYQDSMRVARWWRDDQGAWWQAEVQGEGRVPVPCPQIELALQEIYEGVPL